LRNVLFQRANCIFSWSLKKVENTAAKAAETTAHLALRLQKPIKIVDDLLCVGLDCMETNIPAVKLPPRQVYANFCTKTEIFNAFTRKEKMFHDSMKL
jgi:hypothetical protein